MNVGLQAVRQGAILGSRMAYRRAPVALMSVYSSQRGFSSTMQHKVPVSELSKDKVQAGSEGLHKSRYRLVQTCSGYL
jgi:hypothetical protein